ncbi:MAG: tRNA-dihydrouridine synthase [Candidatus Taylorbacteria bacterium]
MTKRRDMPKDQQIEKQTFWSKLPRPFFVIAPMANVTDSVFRKLFPKYGKPDVMWTEFVSADGLNSAGQKRLLVDLVYSEKERPIVAQLFTGHPDEMKAAAKLVAKLSFDGLDINMGCPDRAVVKQGGGSALMKNQKTALAVLEAAREGVSMSHVAVSVKTRIGFNTIDLSWIESLLKQDLPALTVHLRTKKEMSEVPAHWDLMPEIVKMRDRISPSTLIIGNGDVQSLDQAREYASKYGCDGVMIGRGIFGKPWFFEKGKKSSKKIVKARAIDRTPEEKLKILLEHTKLFDKTYCGKKHLKSFNVMKKHFKAYASGWDGAKVLRGKLMETTNAREVGVVIKEYLLANK